MYVYVQGIDIRLYDWRIITVQAIDFLVRDFGSYPFTSFKILFVEDAPLKPGPLATMAICSNYMLFPPSILDTVYDFTYSITIASLVNGWV